MAKHKMQSLMAAAVLGLSAFAGTSMAQQTNWSYDTLHGKMVINEVLDNPAGSDDDKYEYIEIFGCPGQSLDGLALVIVNSPNGSSAEVDESYYFGTSGKYRLNANGYFVLWNSSSTGTLIQQAANSLVYASLPSPGMRQTATTGLGQNGGDDIDELDIRYEASFRELGSCGSGGCASDGPGKIENDGSMSFILINFAGSKKADGTTALALTDIKKDSTIDTTSDGSFNGQIAYHFSVIDNVAWSNNGGHEYTKEEGDEIDFSPGSYKPDAISRVDNIAAAVSTFSAVNTGTGGGSDTFKSTYTNWVNGDLDSNHPGSYVFGFGGLNYPSGANVSFVVDTDADGFALTPGTANSTIHSTRGQITAGSLGCPGFLMMGNGGDFNGDGAVDAADIIEAIEAGQPELVDAVFEALVNGTLPTSN